MQVLVVAATDFEIAPFRQAYPQADVLITGTGAAPTAYALTKRVNQVDYDLVIQAGIAGSFDHTILPATVVVVKKDKFGDLGAIEESGFQSLFQMGLAGENDYPYRNGWLINDSAWMKETELGSVSAITINTITATPELFNKEKEDFIETMEGAALHFVCLQEDIPFLQIRSISNYVGDRNKQNWKLEEAIYSLNKSLVQIYQKIETR